ncbi:MAG: hypothetical protein OXE94_07930 [Aestuariivita sp.]|nr:hypothetical protein [Aestuariivita sp.]MCY4289754.1 hypothetical protein [Aestuariivita sp.]MCY4347632.1 hypothetical protein [Aestuariivita sp.]
MVSINNGMIEKRTVHYTKQTFIRTAEVLDFLLSPFGTHLVSL